MNYLLSESNQFCKTFGHWWGRWYSPSEIYQGGPTAVRRTCKLCGTTVLR
jgi:hypothetical protein